MEVILRSLTLEKETKSPVETTVKGTVPTWLSGSLYRNGAGVFQVGETKLNHLFDGMAVISRYDIKDGHVYFKNRILRSKTWNESVKANRLVYNQFGAVAIPDPCKSIFSRFFSIFTPPELTDNTSVNVIRHGDALFTMTEVDKFLQIDPTSLDPVGSVKLENIISVHFATAHPLKDHDGTVYNLASNVKNRNVAYNIIASAPNDDKDAKPFDNLRIVGSVPSRWKTYYSYSHSFGMSENYFTILEQNLCISLFKAAIYNFLGYSHMDYFSMLDKEEVQFSILKKKDGERLKTVFRSENLFCFHFINSFEEKDQLVVDLVGYKDSSVLQELFTSSLENEKQLVELKSFFMRFVLPLNVDEATPIGKNLVTLEGSKATAVKRQDGTILLTSDYLNDDPTDVGSRIAIELPTVNPQYVGRPYRYSYGTELKETITKVDTLKRTKTVYVDPKKNSLGEPIFVPSPDAKNEDDGVLLVPVISVDVNSPCYLTILNASTMEVMANCEVPTSTVIPTSFHGFFDSL